MKRYDTAAEAIDKIVEAGYLLYSKGLIVATEGNLSIRIGDDRIVTTPTGVCKGRLKKWDLLTITPDGRKVGGRGQPSSELPLHLALYDARPDIRAIVHAHPPTATGFAVANVPLADCVLPEVILNIGSVPIAPYGTPSTEELPERTLPTAKDHNAFLLKNHGAVTMGDELWEAFHMMELVESFAKIVLTARTLGAVEPLSPDDVKKLLRLESGVTPPASGCGNCATCTGCGGSGHKKTSPTAERDRVDEVLKRIEGR